MTHAPEQDVQRFFSGRFMHPYGRTWAQDMLPDLGSLYAKVRELVPGSGRIYQVDFLGVAGGANRRPGPLVPKALHYPWLFSCRAGRRLLHSVCGGTYAAPRQAGNVDELLADVSAQATDRKGMEDMHGEVRVWGELWPREGALVIGVRHEVNLGSQGATYDGSSFTAYRQRYVDKELCYVLGMGTLEKL